MPELSVVVAIVTDTVAAANAESLGACLAALNKQKGASSIEILVPHHSFVAGIAEVKVRYPGVRFIEVKDLKTYTGRPGSREHHDELRARGLAEAQGEIVAMIEDCGVPDPEWASALLECHKRPCAAAGGAIENGINRSLNWAVYFCDFGRYQNPLPEGETEGASDANLSYKRAALDEIRVVWREIFREGYVNAELRSRGRKVVMAPRAVLRQHRLGLRLGPALRERFVWGRSYAVMRAQRASGRQRFFWATLAPGLPGLLAARMTITAWKKRRAVGPFLRALPWTLALLTSWSLGEMTGYVTNQLRATK